MALDLDDFFCENATPEENIAAHMINVTFFIKDMVYCVVLYFQSNQEQCQKRKESIVYCKIINFWRILFTKPVIFYER
jgi:hypothetical protein